MIKNIILDIDQTLIDSVYLDIKFINQYPPSFLQLENFLIYKRPYFNEFFDYCFKKFDTVSIWTAGTKEWLDTFLTLILNQEQKNKIYKTWYREHCTIINDIVYKKLDKIFLKYSNIFNKNNTIIIDDTKSCFSFNFENGILIKKYSYANSIDDSLLKLIKILDNYEIKKDNFNLYGI
jgi:TFIIF-interacting CTD phosphatase-like protein